VGFRNGPGAWWFDQACQAQAHVRTWDKIIAMHEGPDGVRDRDGLVMCLLRQKAAQEIAVVFLLRSLAEMCNDGSD
jgi:hypothetical protein